MADKRLDQENVLTDFDYALIVKGADVAKISKADLAKVVGGFIGMTKLPGAPNFFFMDSFNLRVGESKTIKLRDGLLMMSPAEATTSVYSVSRWSDTVNQPLHVMGNAVSSFVELSKPRNTTDVTFKNISKNELTIVYINIGR